MYFHNYIINYYKCKCIIHITYTYLHVFLGTEILYYDQLYDLASFDPIHVSNATEIESISHFNSFYFGKCTSIVLKKPREAHEVLALGFGFMIG